MESIPTRLKKTAVMAERLALKPSEIVCLSFYGSDFLTADFHIEAKALVRTFHDLKIKRSEVKARESATGVSISFYYRKFRFISTLEKPEAATFMAINGQRRIETKKPPLRRLSKRSQLRLIDAGVDSQ